MSEQKGGITDGPLPDLATDCLRFTLHFFQLMQMSAQHIYHTALPLSPETSVLRLRFLESRSSWEEDWTTRYASYSSIPATWGPILRTIKDDSGCFTHVTVAGQGIIAICADNTVNVYDGVTGVLKISLNAPQQVTSVEGSPDGSLLFFLHGLAHGITVWDTQTGGLIYTLTTTFRIINIAVSLKGKYLGGHSSGGTHFRFWEVESRRANSRRLGEAVLDICWLEPEDQVALALGETIVILEVTTGRTLRTIDIEGSVKRIAFSGGRRQLAIRTTDKIMTTGIQTGPLSTSSSLIGLTCFAFSTNGDQIICATDTGDLRHLNISTHPFSWSDNLIRLGTIDSVNLLPSGHLVAKVGGSIQLLEKEYTRLPSISVDSEMIRVYQLDDGNGICASFEDHRDICLLDTETMRDLVHHHPTPDERCTWLTPFIPRFICASIDHRIAVLYLPGPSPFVLRLCTIGGDGYRWERSFSDSLSLSAVSPDGEKLVIVTQSWKLYVLRVSDGKNLTPPLPPLFRRAGYPATSRSPQRLSFTP
jgi:WD40 repeat protein